MPFLDDHLVLQTGGVGDLLHQIQVGTGHYCGDGKADGRRGVGCDTGAIGSGEGAEKLAHPVDEFVDDHVILSGFHHGFAGFVVDGRNSKGGHPAASVNNPAQAGFLINYFHDSLLVC